MTCTKQTYTLSPTWTAAQLADTVKTAFIDAGHMTDWHDSFLSGTIENRVIRIVSDNTKSFGTIYYWFMFTTSGIFLNTTTTWNSTTHVPTGVQLQDYGYSLTNNVSYHKTLLSLNSGVQFNIDLFISGLNSDALVFRFRQGTSYFTCAFCKGTYYNPNSFVDQDKFYYNGHIQQISGYVSNSWNFIGFSTFAPSLKKTYMGAALGDVNTTNYQGWMLNMVVTNCQYAKPPTNSTWTGNSNTPAVIPIPCGTTTNNTQLTTNYIPFTTNILMSVLHPALPNDYALAIWPSGTTPVAGDKFIVTAGSNEWEILQVAATAGTTLMFVARVV